LNKKIREINLYRILKILLGSENPRVYFTILSDVVERKMRKMTVSLIQQMGAEGGHKRCGQGDSLEPQADIPISQRGPKRGLCNCIIMGGWFL
jgi:hypothetical protein